MYFWWPIACRQLLCNLRVNILSSVVEIQVSRVMSQTYLTIHITMVFAGCTIVCLVAQYQVKFAKNCTIYGIFYWFEECSFGVVSQVENLVKIFHDHERSWMILSRSLSWKDLAKILASSYQDPVTILNKLMFARSWQDTNKILTRSC